MLLSSSFHYRLTTSGLTEVCVRGSFRFIPSTAHRPQHVSQYTDLTRHGSLSGACYEESQGALFGDFGDVVRLWGRGETTHTGAQWVSVARSNFDVEGQIKRWILLAAFALIRVTAYIVNGYAASQEKMPARHRVSVTIATLDRTWSAPP